MSTWGKLPEVVQTFSCCVVLGQLSSAIQKCSHPPVVSVSSAIFLLKMATPFTCSGLQLIEVWKQIKASLWTSRWSRGRTWSLRSYIEKELMCQWYQESLSDVVCNLSMEFSFRGTLSKTFFYIDQGIGIVWKRYLQLRSCNGWLSTIAWPCTSIQSADGKHAWQLNVFLFPLWFITRTLSPRQHIKMYHSHSIIETRGHTAADDFDLAGQAYYLNLLLHDVIYGYRQLQSSLIEQTGSVPLHGFLQRDLQAMCILFP